VGARAREDAHVGFALSFGVVPDGDGFREEATGGFLRLGQEGGEVAFGSGVEGAEFVGDALGFANESVVGLVGLRPPVAVDGGLVETSASEEALGKGDVVREEGTARLFT